MPAEIDWTEAARAELVRRRHDGETLAAIARTYGVTPGAVGWQLRLAGYYARRRRGTVEGRTKLRSAAIPQERPCMCCRGPFMSEGPHHRLCTGCRRLGDGLPESYLGAV